MFLNQLSLIVSLHPFLYLQEIQSVIAHTLPALPNLTRIAHMPHPSYFDEGPLGQAQSLAWPLLPDAGAYHW